MIKQIKKGYLELPGFVFKQDELVNIAKSINVEKGWMSNFGIGDYVQKRMPNSIHENFKMFIHTWMGFVRCEPGSSVLPHKDSDYGNHEFFSSYGSSKDSDDAYVKLDKQLKSLNIFRNGSRECALIFPVYGDYKKSPTILYNEKTKRRIAKLTLKYPTLVKLAGKGVLHGVSDVLKERVTFQISFYTPLSFEAVAKLILDDKLLYRSVL